MQLYIQVFKLAPISSVHHFELYLLLKKEIFSLELFRSYLLKRKIPYSTDHYYYIAVIVKI